jgi:hypothetical protein
MPVTNRSRKLTAGQRKAAERRIVQTRPGIISFIIGLLQTASERGHALTVEQILTKLARKFPDRDVAGMEVTVRAQLSRIPQERGIDIHKERDGRVMRYMAA